MTFWDSSALVPLLIREPRSVRARQLLKEDALVVAWIAPVEIASALVRLWRERQDDAANLDGDLRELGKLTARWIEIPPHDSLRPLAARLLRRHALRALDALQLASAWVAAEGRPESMNFVCFDARLAAAARSEGFHVRE